MSVRAYQGLRVIVGTAVLLGCGLVFADVRGWLDSRFTDVFLWPQFLPSVLAFLRGAGWMAAGFVAVLVLTALFGRVYCAMLCPLGVLMDAAAWLGRKRGRKRKLPYRRGQAWLRVAVVVATVGFLVSGSAVVLGFLDPFSLFGRIMAGTVRPVAGWANNLLAHRGWTKPVTVVPSAAAATGVAAGMLAVVVLLALRRGRLWCNTLCPVGAVLGALSKFSLFRLSFTSGACTACSLCERSCPAQCIDYRRQRVDHSRCVMCLDCVSACRKTGLNVEFAYGGKLVGSKDVSLADLPTCPSSPPATRRGFLAAAGTLAAEAVGRGRGWNEGGGGGGGRGGGGGGGGGRRGGGGKEEEEGDAKDGHDDRRLTPATKKAVLPPGAVSLAHFQATCTACHLCVTHCPSQVLRPAITQHGLAGFLQPYQDFGVAFCEFNCSQCSQVCPTGAIQPITVEQRQVVQTGVARFFRSRCVVRTEGTACGACAEHCPTQAVHMVPFRGGRLTIPEVTPELCIGCGACEFICPVIPDKAIVVDGLAVHATATRIKTTGQNKVRAIEEEFPF